MNKEKKIWSTQTMIYTAMLAALAGVLMSLEVSVPMMPVFYKVDFSDVPSVIALFLLGPVPAAAVEVIKVLIKLVTVGTNSMYVGEFANLIGIVLFVVPIWLVYKRMGKTRKAGITAMIVSLPIRVAVSCCINAFITLPLYATAMGLPMDELIQTVASFNPAIHNLTTFIVLATAPFNVLKISLNYLVGYLLFERLCHVSFVKREMMS